MNKKRGNLRALTLVLLVSFVISFIVLVLINTVLVSAQTVCAPSDCYSKLPNGFKPILGYYEGYGGGKISLWDYYGNLYQTSDGTNFTKIDRKILANQGLPENFRPIEGYYHNLSGSGGAIYLFNSSGTGYRTANGNSTDWKYYSVNDKINDGLPGDLIVNNSFYAKFGFWNITIFDKDGSIYIRRGVPGNFKNLTNSLYSQFNKLPKGNSPAVVVDYNFSNYDNPLDSVYDEYTYFIYNVSGGLKVYRYDYSQPNGGIFVDMTGGAIQPGSGLPSWDNIPSVGYFDPIRKKIVLWYGSDTYESSDGKYFSKVNCNTNSCEVNQPVCYNGLPGTFVPTVSFYHGLLVGGRISLWNASGSVYQSPDGKQFNRLPRYDGEPGTEMSAPDFEDQGLPKDFIPVLGVYHNISNSTNGQASGGQVILFDKQGNSFKTDLGGGGVWFNYSIQERTSSSKFGESFPVDFKPVAGRWTLLPKGPYGYGVLELVNMSGQEIRRNDVASVWSIFSYSSYPNYPVGKAPNVTYYFDLYGDEGMDYWFNTGPPSSPLKIYRFFPKTNQILEITNQISGVPKDKIPTSGYFELINHRIIVWYGNVPYESVDGKKFIRVNDPLLCISVCGDGFVTGLEQCDDGNTNPGDGCGQACNVETGWSCTGEPSVCIPLSGLIRRTCNDITIMDDCLVFQDPEKLTDIMRQSIHEKSLIANNFCFDPIYTFEAIPSLNGSSGDPSTCGTYTACSCYWDTQTSKCQERTFRATTSACPAGTPVNPLNSCIIRTDSLYGSCYAGSDEYLINWTSAFNGGGENIGEGCVGGEKLLPCPSSANLGFFGFWNLVITSFGILVVYFYLIRKKIIIKK